MVIRASFIAMCLLALASAAQAGIVQWTPSWVDSLALDVANSDLNGGDPGLGTWAVTESYVADRSTSVVIGSTGFADSDPSLHISKDVTNDSTFAWTDYHIIIGGEGVTYVPGTASSDRFGIIVPTGNTIDFYAPATVPIGSTVNVSFDILIPAGSFNFSITQTPTPEPATLGVLAAGGLALLRRRRAQ
jgi:MYXO-CTERM domain-containing protein